MFSVEIIAPHVNKLLNFALQTMFSLILNPRFIEKAAGFQSDSFYLILA